MNGLIKYNNNNGFLDGFKSVFNPFELDHWRGFDEIFDNFGSIFNRQELGEVQEDGSLIQNFNLAGFKKNEVKVNFAGNIVNIEAQNKNKHYKTNYSLDTSVWNPETAAAKLEDGILTLTFKPNEKNKPKEIVVS